MYPGQTDFFLNQYEEAVKTHFGYLLIDLKTTTQDNCRQRTNVLPSEEGFNQEGFHENIPQELLKYLKKQTLSPVPLLPAMQEIQGNIIDMLSRNNLRDEEKAKRYFQLQNRSLAFKKQLNTRTRRGEIIRAVPELTSKTLDSSTATTAFSTPLNPFNVTPELTQAAISQKPDKGSLTPPSLLNPAFLTPPPTVETPSQPGPKPRSRVNYLDDHETHAKQLRKRRHKKFKPYKYSMGEEG